MVTLPGPKVIKIHSVGEDGRLITTWKEIPAKTSPDQHARIVEEILISDSDSDKKTKTDKQTKKLSEEEKKERKKKRVENMEIREFTNKVKSLVEKYKDQIVPKVCSWDAIFFIFRFC